MVSKYQNLGKSWKCKRIIVVFMVWGHLGDSCPTRVDWCVLFLKKIFLLNSRVSFAPDAKQSTSFMSLKWRTTDVLRSSLCSPDQMNPLIVNIFGGSQSTRSCLPGVILAHRRHFFFRSSVAKQIMSKLLIFHNGQLQQLVREPVLQDKRTEHVKFQVGATSLLWSVGLGYQIRYTSTFLPDHLGPSNKNTWPS